MYKCTLGKDGKEYYFKDGKRVSIKNIPKSSKKSKEKIKQSVKKGKSISRRKEGSPIKEKGEHIYKFYTLPKSARLSLLEKLPIGAFYEIVKHLDYGEIMDLCVASESISEKCKNEIIKKLIKEKLPMPWIKKLRDGLYMFDGNKLFRSKQWEEFKNRIYKRLLSYSNLEKAKKEYKIAMTNLNYESMLLNDYVYDILISTKRFDEEEIKEFIHRYLGKTVSDTMSLYDKNVLYKKSIPKFFMSFKDFFDKYIDAIDISKRLTFGLESSSTINLVRKYLTIFLKDDFKDLFPKELIDTL